MFPSTPATHFPQVDLVLSWVSQESRSCVRSAALRELGYLASAAPHAWSQGNVAALVAFTRAAKAGGGGQGKVNGRDNVVTLEQQSMQL